MSDDWTSGESGIVAGVRLGVRTRVQDALLDARRAVRLEPWRLARAAREAPPRRRVLAIGIEREDVLAILGRDVDILVPSHRDITRSVNQGQPIASQRGTEAAKAFRALAELYAEESAQRAAGVSMAPVIELPKPAAAEAEKAGRQSIFKRSRSA